MGNCNRCKTKLGFWSTYDGGYCKQCSDAVEKQKEQLRETANTLEDAEKEYQKGNTDKALAMLKNLPSGVEDLKLLRRKGWLLYQCADYKSALKVYENITKRDPEAADGWCMLAESQRLGWFVLAASQRRTLQLRQAIKNYDHAISFNTEAAPGCLINKGLTCELLKEYKQAIECYDAVLAMMSENGQRFHADAWLSKGVSLGFLGDSKRALACVDKSIALAPSYAEAWNAKAVLLKGLGESEKAQHCFGFAALLYSQEGKLAESARAEQESQRLSGLQ